MYFVDNLKHYSCFRSQYQNKMLNDIMSKDSTHTRLLTQILMTTAGMWIATTNFHTMDITLYKRLQM